MDTYSIKQVTLAKYLGVTINEKLHTMGRHDISQIFQRGLV